MVSGTVSFVAEMPGMQFGGLEVATTHSEVSKIELHSLDGEQLHFCVHLDNVPSPERGYALAAKAAETVAERLSFLRERRVDPLRPIGYAFVEVQAEPGTPIQHFVGDYPHTQDFGVAVVSMGPNSVAALKAELEAVPVPGQRYYVLFRSALQATNVVEQFLHPYHVLLLICGEQRDVDTFIVGQDSSVPQTQHCFVESLSRVAATKDV